MSKQEITEEVIKELNLDITILDATRLWWWPNYRQGVENLRLTDLGVTVLSKAMQPHEFHYTAVRSLATLQKLQHIPSPFHVDFYKNKIIIFSAQLVAMARLYDDFARMLDLLSQSD